MNYDLDIFKFQHPFTCMVVGPTSSGKTVLVRKLLANFKSVININKNTLRVLWCYGQWQPLYSQDISSSVQCIYFSGLPDENEIKQQQPDIIIIDDLMSELGNSVSLANLFTKGSHHLNISVIFISQNLFHQGKQMRNIGLNCHYYLLLKNPRDRGQIMTFARSVFTGKTKQFLNAYNDSTSENYGYLKVDLTQKIPDSLRVRTKIFPNDIPGYIFAPTVYQL
jgi:hypothetical protein